MRDEREDETEDEWQDEKREQKERRREMRREGEEEGLEVTFHFELHITELIAFYEQNKVIGEAIFLIPFLLCLSNVHILYIPQTDHHDLLPSQASKNR